MRVPTTSLPPTEGGVVVVIHDIIARTSSVSKISVPDPSYAVENIVVGLKECGLLFFDNTQPLIKLPLCYRRISVDQEETLIFNLLDEQAQIAVSNVQIREAMKRIRFIPSLQIDLKAQFWKSQLYVNLTSGIYDIMKQETVPLRNELVFDYCINIRYIPHSNLEDAPVFKHFVETSLGMEQLKCLLRVLGYCISCLTKGRKAFVFYGIGRTGKSTILNVLEAVVGDGFVSHESFHNMSGERAKAHYEGKLMNISRETSTKVNKQEESFKSLVSCEHTTGSEKFEKQRDFIATLSFVFAGNSDVDFAVMDDAILDRLVYVMFTREIPDEEIDLELESKLLDEEDVIFSLALDSLKGLIEDKYDFRMSAAAEEHIQHRRFLIHSAESFLQERCSLSEKGRVSKVTLYDAYKVFCDANALKPETRNRFYARVRNYDNGIKDGRVVDKTGSSVQGFHGIALCNAEIQPKNED